LTTLLDVNVLMALAWPNHVHHPAAARWFRQHRDDGWATCPSTEAGFVRVSANPTISGGAVTPAAATELLRRLRELGQHRFWADTISFVTSPEVPRDHVHGHRQVTVAHLLAIALAQEGRLATFDRGVLALGAPDTVVLLRQ
jgi:hypothetical protein